MTKEQQLDDVEFLDSHCRNYPHPKSQFSLLRSDWQHFRLEKEAGKLLLTEERLNDQFVPFCDDCFRGLTGKNVLELGPYEGFHSFALQEAGVREAISIEGNPRNFLKCLIVKNYYRLSNVTFLLGDFTKYLKNTERRFDFVLAAGVLYHLSEPFIALDHIMKLTDSVGICTTYYDKDNLKFEFTGQTRTVNIPNTPPFLLHERKNPKGTRHKKSGIYDTAWMFTKDALLSFLECRGFNVVIRDPPKRPYQAPRVQLFAQRRP